MNIKPFNLEEFRTNPLRKVVTREGKPVRILCTDAKGDYPIFGLALDEDGSEYTIRCKQDGIGSFDEDDLFFAPTNHEGFMNIYYRDNRYISGVAIHNTEEEAKRFIFPDRGYITTIKVEWED